MIEPDYDLAQHVAPGTARRGACSPEPYVKLTDRGNVWITLPGDAVSHMLAPGEARKLFRELEEVV